MKRITRRNLLQGLTVALLSAALLTSFELEADDFRKSGPSARIDLASTSTEQFGAGRLRRTIPLDGEEWGLRPFAFGQGVRERFPQDATASGAKPVAIPNDVQLTSFVSDPLGQSAEIVDVNKKEWWYTRSFESPKLEVSQQATLVFDGVDYFADIWLNGEKLGSHEGAYTRFSFDVTTRLSTKGANYLAVRVTAPWTVPGRSHYEFMKGEFDEFWDALPGPGMVVYPLGLHRGVRMEITSRTRIDAVNVSTTEIGEHRAELKVSVELNNRGDATEGDIHLTIVPDNFSGKPINVAPRPFSMPGGPANEQRIEWSISIPDARLWWTWDTGDQDLYRAEASVVARNGSVLDRMTATFGIRTFERDENLLYRINGRPIFFRGAWYPMSKLYPSWMFKSFPEIPVGGFGVIDAFDKANRAYYEQKRTFASVNMSFARRYALESILAGSLLRVPVWISNAEPMTLSEVTVEFSLCDLQGQSLQSQSVATSIKANRAEAVANVEWAAPQQAGIYVLRGWARQSGKQLASAQTYVKVVSGVTQKRVLVIGSAEWAQPVCGYLSGLGAQVTLTLAEYSIVHPMHFPASAAELKKNFDVIWLTGYDKYWREAPEQLTTLIAEAVRSGVTFVHTGSPASFHGGGENTAALDLTALGPVLPVEVSHENDVLWQPSFRVGSELNPLRSHAVRQVIATEHAPEWLRQIGPSDLAPASFHMLPARDNATVLMTIDGQPLIVKGNFGTGQTFAYLGFTPQSSKDAAGNPLILDRVIRASGEGRQFAIMSAILLALASGTTPSTAIADLIDSRAKPMFESLIELPAGSAPRATASWSRRQDGRLSGHVRIENGDSYALDLRVRLTGSDIQSGRVLQLWSNQYFDLLPHEVTECDVTIYVQDGGEPGQITLLLEDFRGSRWEQPVEY